MPHWEWLHQVLHAGPHAWWRALGHGFLVCAQGCLVSNGHEAQIFFHMEELPWGILPTDPLKISHFIHQASRIHIYLGILRRVVAMRLQMEIILFIKEDQQSDGSSFPSTSTYLQSKSSWCPSLNSQGLRVRMSHIWPITLLFSHRKNMIWA